MPLRAGVKRMAPKRTPTSAVPAMSQAAIRKLVADSVAAALEDKLLPWQITDITIRNTGGGGREGTVSLIRWFEQTESVFSRSNCTEDCKVKYATSTLTEEALSWWNSFAQPEFKKLLIKKYCLGTRERALQKPMPKSKQQCPWKSILAKGQEHSPRPERSHGFDVVIGMDWLSKYRARIICDEKVVHIPIDGETLII
ncbi:hypothetical protein Tco_0587546 [Tanacetum coccineum]